ncbi:MAG: hypothetical protein AB1567_04050 [bacterium]
MTVNEIKEIKEISIKWIKKNIGRKRTDYQDKLIGVINDLFPDDIGEYDGWRILENKSWDQDMCDRLEDILDDSDWHGLSKGGIRDVKFTIRFAMGLVLEPKNYCGVILTVGDLRRFFDGNIPDEIVNTFTNPQALAIAKDEEIIWF